MIDIHNHIIPNIDDGSDSLELSRQLLIDAIEEEITDVCITPHFMNISSIRRHKKESRERLSLYSLCLLVFAFYKRFSQGC